MGIERSGHGGAFRPGTCKCESYNPAFPYMTVIENDAYRIDPLGAGDIRHYEELAAEIYHLLTDEHTLQFLPEKKLPSLEAAKNWLNAAMLNFHSGRNQLHLIGSKKTGLLVGVNDLAAVVNLQIIDASKVLKRSGFQHEGGFDPVQDIYRYSSF